MVYTYRYSACVLQLSVITNECCIGYVAYDVRVAYHDYEHGTYDGTDLGIDSKLKQVYYLENMDICSLLKADT